MNRQELQQHINDLNDRFNETKVLMEKSGASPEQIQDLYKTRSNHERSLREMSSDALTQLNLGNKQIVKGGTTLGGLPQTGQPDMSEVVGLGKENMWRSGRVKDLMNKASDVAGDVADVGRKVAKRAAGGLKSVPILGSAIGLGSAIYNQDASAAMPGLNEAESLGPEAGTPEHILENPTSTPEQREEAHRELQGFPAKKFGKLTGSMK